MLALLYSVAEDQARADGFVHRSVSCNSCSVSPIRGIRYKCSTCFDFDLCESCEFMNTHDMTHVFLKIRVPLPPLNTPKISLIQPLYPGLPVSQDTTIDYPTLSTISHFNTFEIDALYIQFKSLSTPLETNTKEGGISKHVFVTCLGGQVTPNLITDRMFLFFDRNQDGCICFVEFVQGLSVLCKGSFDERVHYAFKGYDLNQDRLISRTELHAMFTAYFQLSMDLVKSAVKTMEDGLMDNFDDQGNKPVSASFSAHVPTSSRVPTSDIDRVKRKQESEVGGGGGPSRQTRRVSSHRPSLLIHPFMISPDKELSPWLNGDLSDDDQAPFVMEAMTQEAIDEMVQVVFQLANASHLESLDYQSFKTAVEKDSNVLSWFECLGSVF